MTAERQLDPLPALNKQAGIKNQIKTAINLIDHGLSYAECTSLSGGSLVRINARDLDITGQVGGADIEKFKTYGSYESISELSRKVSQGMAKVAKKSMIRPIEWDKEWSYPVFIGSSDSVGTVYMLFRDPNIKASIVSARNSADKEILTLESTNIKERSELKVLLGGLASFLSAIEASN